MKLILPPGVSAAQFDQALAAFRRIVGDDYVFATDEDRDTYLDPYAPGDGATHAASAGVAPKTVEEIQALLKVANEHKVPLWPISRGKNFGYGTAAPRMAGTVVLDLARMNRILEVNEDMGYVVVEPGVGFNDLFKYLKDNKIKLWMSAPAQTWGSVVGNALERGVGYTPYGDHANRICGMEVVLANGRVVRTGMGAMSKGSSWQLFKYGFGPSWEGAFMQSNFGIVTKMGLWMMPAPVSTTSLSMSLPNEDDLGPAVDAMRPLKLAGVVQANPSIGNVIRAIALKGPREQWYKGEGPIPQDALEAARKAADVGWWNFSIRLFDLPEVNEIHARVVRDAFAKVTKAEFKTEVWHEGDAVEKSGEAFPSLAPLNIVNWRGGRGGHLTFSPISPPRGEDAMRQYRMMRRRYEEYGFDYSGGFTAGERYLNHITMIIYDRDDDDMTAKARELFKVIVRESAEAGYGEYRTHVSFFDDVAATYDWGGHALMHLNETVKDALDPNGIIAPGKQGVWPARLRKSNA
jgi:4-cresol dehydrogenase (hydroxylating)